MGKETTLARGYHEGSVDVVLSVDDVARQAEELRSEIPESNLIALAGNAPFLSIRNLRAGYGNMEILHDFTLHVARAQSLCLIAQTEPASRPYCIPSTDLPGSTAGRSPSDKATTSVTSRTSPLTAS